MKKLLSIIICLAMLFSLITALPASAETALQTEVGEDGKTYYLIGSADDYLAFVTLANADLTINAKLTADIDLSGKTVTSIGTAPNSGQSTATSYQGIFDGQGHIIKNMSISRTYSAVANAGIAMFNMTDGATIKNLGIENATITNKGAKDGVFLSALVARAYGTTIENCYVKNSTIQSEKQNNYIQAAGPVAAFINSTSLVKNCYAVGNKVGFKTSGSASGGVSISLFVGWLGANTTENNIVNCYAKGNSFINRPSGQKSAGFARMGSSGDTNAKFVNSYTDTLSGFDSGSTMSKLAKDAAEWATLAETLGSAFKNDTYNLNGGAPRLAWEKDPAVYAVNIDANITNGTVTADKTTALAGETVALAVTPASGYIVSEVKVNGESLEAPYTFTMPAGAVTVTAKFIEAKTYAINLADSDDGVVTANKTSAYPGEEIVLTITPNAGFVIDRVFATLPTDDFSVTELSSPYTFIMPECDVDVMVQYQQFYFGEIEGNYCLIGTPEEYVEFRNLANANPYSNAKLTADLDMSEYIGRDLSIGNYDSNLDNGDSNVSYCGIFDGNGHVIKNLSITRRLYDASNRGLAMFNRTNGATIKNLGLENAAVLNSDAERGDSFIAGFVAYASGETCIENCYITDSTILQNNSAAVGSAGSIIAYMGGDCVIKNTYARGNEIGNAFACTVTTTSGNCVSTFVGRTASTITADSIVNCYSKDNKLVNIGNSTRKAGFARVGSSGNTDVAFVGSYTDYLTGFDANSSMNKLASDSEDWKTLASSLGSAYRNDNAKFPQNGGAPRLKWERIPDYEILEVIQEDTLKVSVIENTPVENAKVYIASYDKAGNMLALDFTSVSELDNAFESTVTVDGASKIKAFIWGGDLAPLSYAYTGTVIKGQLFDDKNLPYTIENGVMTVESTLAETDYESFEDTLWSEEEGVGKIVIGAKISKIGANAFAGFSDVTYVEIPENVTEIADNAFADISYSVCGYASSAAEAFATKKNNEFFLKKLRILTIGNSHTSDHGQWNKIIFNDLYDAGIETEIVYTRLTNGGFTMYRDRGKTDDGYPKSHYVNGTTPGAALYSKYATQLDNYTWDLVLIQDYRESGEDADVVPNFTEGMAKTMKWLRSKQPGAKIGWIVDWVDKNYDVSSVAELSELYNRNTVRNMQTVLSMESDAPDYIIPMGTALINARTSYLSNVMNAADCYTNDSNSDWVGSDKIVKYNLLERDGTHVSYELGRYITGAAVFGYIFEEYKDKLIGGDKVDFCSALKTGPETTGKEEWKGEFTDSIWNITKETVRNTISNPYQITPSQYTVDPAAAMAEKVVNASYPTFTKAGIANTIKSLGQGFTVTEDDVTISGNTATVRFLYGYTEKKVTITK